jgi:hypothetical protein
MLRKVVLKQGCWLGCAGVSDNRLQNVVITLDKIKLCLQKSGNTCKPPLRLLSDAEATEYLWTGARSPVFPTLRLRAPKHARGMCSRARTEGVLRIPTLKHAHQDHAAGPGQRGF